jgi:hypothetical protein
VTGFLTGGKRNDDKTVKYFLIDVETVTFLGQASGATVPRAEESPTKNGMFFSTVSLAALSSCH